MRVSRGISRIALSRAVVLSRSASDCRSTHSRLTAANFSLYVLAWSPDPSVGAETCSGELLAFRCNEFKLFRRNTHQITDRCKRRHHVFESSTSKRLAVASLQHSTIDIALKSRSRSASTLAPSDGAASSGGTRDSALFRPYFCSDVGIEIGDSPDGPLPFVASLVEQRSDLLALGHSHLGRSVFRVLPTQAAILPESRQAPIIMQVSLKHTVEFPPNLT